MTDPNPFRKECCDFQYTLLMVENAKFQKPFLEPFFALKPIEGSFDRSLIQADKTGLKVKQKLIICESSMRVNSLTYLFLNLQTSSTRNMVNLKSWKEIPGLKGPGWKTIQFHGRIYPPGYL